MRAARRILTSATSATTPMMAVATMSTHGSADGTRAVYAVGPRGRSVRHDAYGWRGVFEANRQRASDAVR
jgi:hypothetical protein